MKTQTEFDRCEDGNWATILRQNGGRSRRIASHKLTLLKALSGELKPEFDPIERRVIKPDLIFYNGQ
ncbi:hypothetical protein [Lyngbya sp. CCY1209]|uniref:hypothetical protein n=1 Tax=Lyngbya sp. CCY1209 TaxID=2886103 RepID=UPI002D2176D2|nr:hypothetical protein [Lyngbya sp. CCY1209]MEB3883979.1 hypothetical protein [Lyngbya sp. CCY1209]